MKDFLLNDEKIKAISDGLEIKPDDIEKLNSIYKDISKGIKPQYLAHIIRTVEYKLKIETHNPFFQIICEPYKEPSKETGYGSILYYEGTFCTIYYNPDLEEKTIRNVIAHELGHLVLETLSKKELPNQAEPLSSVLGLLIIMDKNDFYANKTSAFQYLTWEDLLSEFVLLKNQSEEIFNIS